MCAGSVVKLWCCSQSAVCVLFSHHQDNDTQTASTHAGVVFVGPDLRLRSSFVSDYFHCVSISHFNVQWSCNHMIRKLKHFLLELSSAAWMFPDMHTKRSYNLWLGLTLALLSALLIGGSVILKKKALLRLASAGHTRAGEREKGFLQVKRVTF